MQKWEGQTILVLGVEWALGFVQLLGDGELSEETRPAETVCSSSQILCLKNRNCLALFSKSLPEEDVMLQVVILGLLPITLNKVAGLHMLIKQVILIPVPIRSGFLLLTSASSLTGAVKQMTCRAAPCSDRALIYRLRSLKALSWADQCPFGLGPN